MNRPFDTKSRPAAVWAIQVAVRENTLRMPDPISIVSVFAARYPICDTASKLYASGTHTTSRPAFSRSTTFCTSAWKSPE